MINAMKMMAAKVTKTTQVSKVVSMAGQTPWLSVDKGGDEERWWVGSGRSVEMGGRVGMVEELGRS